MPMTSSSRHIYFYTPSGNQTKLWPFEKYWFWEFYNVRAFAVFDKFVQFFIAYYLSSLLLLTSFVFGRLTARNCPQWSQTELQFAKFQNILISASWFHTFFHTGFTIADKEWKELYVNFKRATLEISSKEAGRIEHNKATGLPGKSPR